MKQFYHKLGRRNAMAISVASVAILLDMKRKICVDATIAMGALAPTPIRANRAEKTLIGKKVDIDLIKKCAEVAAKSTRPIDDIRATAEYRRTVCGVLVRRLISEGLGFENGFENANREE
jgi:CO/xanthine dehydrogenase FAD-binding subunit